MTKYLLAITLALLPFAGQSKQMQHGHEHQHEHIHAHLYKIPIGIMGGHLHPAGRAMVSARFMGMDMRQLLDGTAPVESANFHMLPQDMVMIMPMIGGMYAPLDHLTLMAMMPGHWMHMTHTHHEETMQMQAIGLGDLNLSAMLGLGKWNGVWGQHQLHSNMGLGLPTGQIDIQDDNQILPYSMRLGSGTWDFVPGLTYTGEIGAWDWGLQPMATLRLATNSLGYRLGHRLQVNAWGSWQPLPWLSTSLRLQSQFWGNVEGEDQRLSEQVHTQPGADPQRQSGSRVDLLGGLSLNGTPQFFPGHRLGIEIGLPVYQSLAGPQLGMSWLGIVGWEWGF